MDQLLELLPGFLSGLIGKAPWLGSILLVIGGLRVILKPIMSVLLAYVQYTPSQDDDSKLSAFMDGKLYKTLSYALDWLASIKLPQNSK